MNINKEKAFYLGDGLYVKNDGFQIILYTQREGVTHWVALEDVVLDAFWEYIKREKEEK